MYILTPGGYLVEVFYRGDRLTVLLMPGASVTFEEACARVPGNKDACPAQLLRLLKRLADFGTLHSCDQFRHEGDQIYAIKARCGLRAYGWFDAYEGRTAFVISHYILKRRDKFASTDREAVLANRTTFKERP
jgi:hypothetical protein